MKEVMGFLLIQQLIFIQFIQKIANASFSHTNFYMSFSFCQRTNPNHCWEKKGD